jgi:hypothetical protein
MACPFFAPEAVTDTLRAARTPLGNIFRGTCEAGPEPTPTEDGLIERCNFGYGRGECPRFPEDAFADAVRFARYKGDIVYVLEKDYVPVEHGLASTLDPASRLGRQAAVFAIHTHS